MHSIIRWASQGALPHKLLLFYSNRKAEDAAFLENVEELARQNSQFRFIPTITNSVRPSWPYERGRIDAKMLTRHLAELKGPVYYLAGPSGMVTAMCDLLRSLGISEGDIKTEEFGEYSGYVRCPILRFGQLGKFLRAEFSKALSH
jgi:ferredoxin-NADP reductase